MSDSTGRENAVLVRLAQRLQKAPPGEVWLGDDAAVLRSFVRPVITTDLVVEGVHVDRRWCSTEDIGWKSISVNVSDIAAMGGEPRAVVVAIAGATAAEIDELMGGAELAARYYGCAIVGGDITDSATLTIAVTVIGETSSNVVLRSGARPGDLLYSTGPFGGSAAGLRLLQKQHDLDGELMRAHRRPIARVEEGRALAELGAHAMLDCSDGLDIDIDRLARASGVGVELDAVPSPPGVFSDEAFSGGEDYELIAAVGPDVDVVGAFHEAGLRSPVLLGRATFDVDQRTLKGETFYPHGYQHQLGSDKT